MPLHSTETRRKIQRLSNSSRREGKLDLETLSEEGEASDIAEGDVIGRMCEKHGLERPAGI